MNSKSVRAFLLALGVLLALSACGTNFGSQASARNTPGVPGNQPDRVQIQKGFDPSSAHNSTIMLTQASLAQRLYATTGALPQMPRDQPCTSELGMSYTLVFLRGEKTLATVVAQRFSCQTVTTSGSKKIQRATPSFWALVDQAVYAATPVVEPQWLAIAHTSPANQPPLTARITSAATTQQLYNAILALPLASANATCSTGSTSAYSLLFHTANLALPASIDDGCNTISLDGQWRTRGGNFAMTGAFKQLLARTLNGAAYAPAQPDQLSLIVQPGNSEASQRAITNASLIQRLYSKALALQPQTQPPAAACTSGEDKLKGTGKGYTFNFSQWGLPLLYVFAHEGSCTMITRGDNVQPVQGDSEFWNLVHQAAGE